MRCVDLYNQSQSKWFEEMVTSSLVNTIYKSLLSRKDSALFKQRVWVVVFRSAFSFPLQELERLEVERVEMIQQHLRQYTTLRHETDMFKQSVSRSCLRHTHARCLRHTHTASVTHTLPPSHTHAWKMEK